METIRHTVSSSHGCAPLDQDVSESGLRRILFLLLVRKIIEFFFDFVALLLEPFDVVFHEFLQALDLFRLAERSPPPPRRGCRKLRFDVGHGDLLSICGEVHSGNAR